MILAETVLVDDIHLGDPAFWKLPTEERERAFLTLRSRCPVSFHREHSDGPLPAGPGFWAERGGNFGFVSHTKAPLRAGGRYGNEPGRTD